MPQTLRRGGIGLGLIAVMVALAPTPPQQEPRLQAQPHPQPTEPPSLAELSQLRAQQGTQTYDLAWLYYTENRIDADKVYRWSRRAWEADTATATDQAARVSAAETHLTRMLKLEAKIAKIRQLGFGNSLDVAEVEYYRKEAEFWLATARGR